MRIKMRKPFISLIAMAITPFISACQEREVSHPFYLNYREDGVWQLVTCLEKGTSCAVDGLPLPPIYAAGANDTYVTVQNPEGYYYLPRVQHRVTGWDGKPESIVGPIPKTDFEIAQRKLDLPDLSVRP
ncbi:hypothetical protein GRI97_06020 [Altererythrobacter xixiisoli]|uniref:Lipoprotein n=1 Tax=Croceibacterium xixiisoli TaxID=1476466 RepID=A0A6I4TTS9_9SPHN|nr:hypothetical protein [Croceibacterium xixiisoli]MXO98541.1 hypothetical protein [Croceibacterium xixiisoli]